MNQTPPPLPPHYERLGRQLTAAAADLAHARATRPTVARRLLRPRVARLAVVPALAIAVATTAALLPTDGHDGAPASAFAAPLVRFAHASPRVLLSLPGWHVVDADGLGTPRGEPAGDNGHLYLVQGSATPRSRAQEAPAGVAHADRGALANRVAELTWSTPTARERAFVIAGRAHDATGLGAPARRIVVEAHGHGWLELSADVIDDRQLLRFRATVADRSVFRSELSALRTVDATNWLRAMPPNVIANLIAVVNVSDQAAATSPTGTDPTGTDPTGTDPTGTDPTGTNS